MTADNWTRRQAIKLALDRDPSVEDEHFAVSELISIMALADAKGLLLSELMTRMGSREYTRERARAHILEAQDRIREVRRAKAQGQS